MSPERVAPNTDERLRWSPFSQTPETVGSSPLEDILRVYLEGPFALTAVNGERETFGDSRDPLSLAPLLRLMGRAVSAVRISHNSDLAIEFADGSRLDAAPVPKFEAWGIEGLDKLLMHCPPAGANLRC
jgi:hypothetical protein